MTSHPMRVRGLKSTKHHKLPEIKLSHPMRVRGLKYMKTYTIEDIAKSHPMRVRGLKCAIHQNFHTHDIVAPHAGAWIEIQR